jgi:hypothetical protein
MGAEDIHDGNIRKNAKVARATDAWCDPRLLVRLAGLEPAPPDLEGLAGVASPSVSQPLAEGFLTPPLADVGSDWPARGNEG